MKYEQILEEGLEKIFEALVGDNGLLKQRLKRLTTNPDEGLGGNAIQDLVNEIHRLKDIEYKYENETKKDFKDGVHDGLMVGVRDEDNYTHDYKEGYDFGVGLHTEIEEMQEKESQQIRRSTLYREEVRGEDKFYERRK
tara:strand:- start:812 stop:1228 length:417 start_codon:yes stop_codon:yes gene_type:complete